MEALFFSLNAVLPLVLLVGLGYFIRRAGWVNGQWAKLGNRLCFRLFLPALLFLNIYEADSLSDIDWPLVIYAGAGTLAAFALGWAAVRLLVPERKQKGVVIQCAFRSNFAVLGMPLALALHGSAGGQAAAVLSLTTIPLFNILAVIILRVYGSESGQVKVGAMLRDILKNPLIQSVLAALAVLGLRGVLQSMDISFRLTDLSFLYSAIKSVSAMASPLALLVLGALFNFSSVAYLRRPLLIGVALRLVIVPALTLTAAYLLFPRFHGAGFAGLMALFASPVSVSSAVMASEMGSDGELAGQFVFWTTLVSGLTVFLFVWIFRGLGAL